jgi:hypothetical protein
MTKETEKQIAEIHTTIVKGAPADDALRRAARAVVDARHYLGDDGWDKLKNAIGQLEEMVGRSDT